VLTHKNLLTNINAIIEAANFSDRDVSLSWMPLTHDMGLIGFHLNMLVCGITQHLMPTDLFVRRPLLWLMKLSEKKANISCSPNFGYKHVLKAFKKPKLKDTELSHVRLIFNGAEPISARLCNEFLDRLAPFGLRRTVMFTVYGLAEASLAVSFPDSESLFKTLYVDRNTLKVGAEVRYTSAESPEAVSFVSVGRPVRDCQVKVVDEHSKELAQDRVGHLYIKGANVTGGYLKNDEANRSVFDAEGWLDTGDLGLMCNGELVITGRSKDIIFVNGQNYFPHDLESIAHQYAGLELGKVVVSGTRAEGADVDDLLVFVLFRGLLKDFQVLATELGRLLNEKTGLEVTHVIPVKRIPKTTSGKIQRHLLAEQYQRGDFSNVLAEIQVLRSSSASGDGATGAIEGRLMQICNTAIPDKCIGVHDNLFKIGTSSLVLVEIHEGIEQEFPGILDISDLFDHPSIAELAVYLGQRMN
jgi:acyl-CoA synthetase (AMP-forming)/AMP-acid ligase II